MSSISIANGNILDIKVDAIVNSSNPKLFPHSGINETIFTAAGKKELQDYLKDTPKCEVGSAVLSPAFKISNAKYIIHAVGPNYKGYGEKAIDILYKAYTSTLEKARLKWDIHSIAFPLIGSGISGFPIDIAWTVAIKACRDYFAKTPYEDYSIIFLNMDQSVVLRGKSILERFEKECPTSIPNERMLLESVDRNVLRNAIVALTKYNTQEEDVADKNIIKKTIVYASIDERIVEGFFLLGNDSDYLDTIEEVKKVPCTELDAFQVRTMLTFIKQGEKFCNGHISKHIENKNLVKIFLRIDDLMEKNKIEGLYDKIEKNKKTSPWHQIIDNIVGPTEAK